jgi:excisionase family DNA binding protein
MSAYATTMPEVLEQLGSSAAALSTRHSGLTRDEVMTAREVSDLLKMPVSTVYELARRGEIPARRLGRTWRFLRPRLEELLAT